MRAAQYLELLNVRGQKMGEIERTGRIAGIADVDAIDQDLGVIGVGAAHKYRRLPAGTAGLNHVESGDGV